MNQHSEFQAFNPKQQRRRDFNNKKNNKRAAAKRAALAAKKQEKKQEETEKHIENPNNVPGKLNCQSGITSIRSLLTYLPIVAGLDTDRIVSEVENVTALYFALRDSQSTTQAASIMFLYIKSYCSGSLLTQLVEFIRTECDFNLLDPQDSDEPEWLRLMKSLKSNWSAVSNNKAFQKISTLLSMSAALGLCSLSNLKFDVNGIRVFSIPAYKKHVGASDLFGAVFDTFTYFIEGGYKCFQQGSLTPFIFSGDEAMQFEQDYFAMLDLAPFMKAGNLLTKKNVTENDFDFRLNKLIDKADALYKASEGTWEKKVLFDRLSQLRKIRAEFIAVRVDGKLRQAPFSIYIEGPSGVGKSSVSALLMRIVLMSNGFDASDERLITLNEADKYMSTYRSHINGIFIDDLGNTQAQYVEKSPVEKVIEMVNNVPAYANMAEADLKGKVSIEPHCLVGTSNMTLYSLASHYSNEPYSIVRRFPLQLYVTVKDDVRMEDGRLDSSLVHKKYPNGIPAIPDLWNIEIYIPFEDSQNLHRRSRGKADIYQVIALAKSMSKQHFCNQKEVVEFASNLDQRLADCSWERPEPLNNQVFEEIPERTRELIRQIREFESPWLRWTNYVPDYLFDNHYVDAALSYVNRGQILADTADSYRAWKGSLVVGIISLLWSWMLAIFLVFSSSYLYCRTLYRRKSEILQQLRDANGAMPLIFRRIRDNHVATIAVAGSLMGVLYMMMRAYRASRVLSDQGNLAPMSPADVAERDAEENPWAGVHITKPSVAEGADGIQRDALKQRVFENLFYLEIYDKDKKRFCDAFFVKSNIALIPNHMMKSDEAIGKFYRRGGETNGAYFKANLSRTFSVHIPNTDLLMVWVPNAGSVRDLTKYLAIDEYARNVPATMIWKSVDGECKEFDALLRPGNVVTLACTFKGFNYSLAEETFNGMCMGTWVSNSVAKQIIAFHLGGKGKIGGAGMVTAKMIADAEILLRKIDGVLVSKSRGKVMTEQYGISFYEGPHVHDKSPTRFLPKGNNIEVFGSVSGRVTPYSDVEPTVISPHVEEVCGVAQQWGKPQFGPQRWKPWQVSLEQSSNPSMGMEGNLLQQAVRDYESPLVRKLRESSYWRDEVRPLTKMETVCGRDGKRFIDKMKPSTSMGYPLSGPKSEHMTLLDPEDFDDFQCPVELDQKYWDELAHMESLWVQGERAYPIFKASLKDEPTKLTKDKVRVFQAAPIALQLAVRKYFLSIARFLSMHPLDSECAVGINAQGPEWDAFAKHIRKYGENRILAGDYSKYDLRMSSQLISAAFRVLIDLARISGNYTEDDISIMEGVASEISSPLMAFNGDYILHVGSNPSGQNLTVYINSIVNSLLFRCAYFHIFKDERNVKPFREVCSLGTYGDDAKSSVKEGFDAFNHISVASFLADRDMKFTMPDKESVPTKYMSDEDADFLKRKNVLNQETGLLFGALDESSIFKSLHSVLRSKAVTNEEQCMCNIDGALREWFAHGRDVYEKRRAEMQSVASRAGLAYGCTQLSVSYDEALDRFCEKYGVTVLDNQSGEIPLESEQFDQLEDIFALPMKARNWAIDLNGYPLGEIDLVLVQNHEGANVIVLVECKAVNSFATRCKARQQIRRYSAMMKILQAKACIIGYIYCGTYLERVVQHGSTDLKILT